MIQVLLADDHPSIVEGLTSWLDADPDFNVVGHAESGEELLQRLRRIPVDVVVLDLRLPGMSGTEVCKEVSARHPGVRLVAFTGYPEDSTILSAFEAGASAFVLKRSHPSLIREAVRSAASGGRFIDPSVGDRVVRMAVGSNAPERPHKLTRRELGVLSLFGEGLSTAEMAGRLGIAVPTVKTHVRNILRKLEVKDRAQAAAKAIKEGLL